MEVLGYIFGLAATVAFGAAIGWVFRNVALKGKDILETNAKYNVREVFYSQVRNHHLFTLDRHQSVTDLRLAFVKEKKSVCSSGIVIFKSYDKETYYGSYGKFRFTDHDKYSFPEDTKVYLYERNKMKLSIVTSYEYMGHMYSISGDSRFLTYSFL